MKNSENTNTVSPNAYGKDWIGEAWGAEGSEAFVSSLGLNIRPRVAAALGLVELKPGDRVLDVACGRGEVSFHAARQGATAVGIDFSPDILHIAETVRSRLPADAAARCKFIQGDVTNRMMFAEATFDYIFLLDIVEHLRDDQIDAMYAELARVIKDDGVIVLHTLPNRWALQYTYRLARFFLPLLPREPRNVHERQVHVNEQTIVSVPQRLALRGFVSRVEIRSTLVDHALWHKNAKFGDKRDIVYKLCRSFPVRFALWLIGLTPLKLLVFQDIFAVAAKKETALNKSTMRRSGLWERMVASARS